MEPFIGLFLANVPSTQPRPRHPIMVGGRLALSRGDRTTIRFGFGYAQSKARFLDGTDDYTWRQQLIAFAVERTVTEDPIRVAFIPEIAYHVRSWAAPAVPKDPWFFHSGEYSGFAASLGAAAKVGAGDIGQLGMGMSWYLLWGGSDAVQSGLLSVSFALPLSRSGK